MMLRRCLIAATLACVALTAADDPVPVHPNFSGRWKMVKDQSKFGAFPVPDMIVRVVDHHEPTMNVHTIQTAGGKTSTADVSYFTDGTVAANVISGRDASSKAYWNGAALEVRTEMKSSRNEPVVIEDHWELSDDRKTLTTTSHITTEAGEADLSLVCEKE